MPQILSGTLGGGVIQPETRKTARHTQTATGAGLIKVIGVQGIIRLAVGLVKEETYAACAGRPSELEINADKPLARVIGC